VESEHPHEVRLQVPSGLVSEVAPDARRRGTGGVGGEECRAIFDKVGFWIQELMVGEDHVHLFLEVSPRYSVARVEDILKSMSVSLVRSASSRGRERVFVGEPAGGWLRSPHRRGSRDRRLDPAVHPPIPAKTGS